MNKTLLLTLCVVLFAVLCLHSASADAEADPARKRNKAQGGNNAAKKTNSKRRKLIKKNKKNKNGKNARRPRKQKKQSRTGRRRSSKGCGRQSTFCPAEKAQTLNLYYNKMTNYFKQLKRAENWAKIVGKKKEKKDAFTNDALVLEDAVGGNFSAPACGSRGFARTHLRSASSAKEQGEKLKNCSNSISESCADITIDTTVAGDCNDKMLAFQNKTDTCITSDDCTCWTEAYAMKSDLSNCSAKEEMERVQGLKTGCLGKFSECKQAQDGAAELTSVCGDANAVTTTASSMMTTMAAKRRKLIADILQKNVIKRHSVDRSS